MNSYTNSPHARPLARTRNGMFIAGLKMLVVCSALLVYVTLAMDWVTNSQALVAYTLLLLGYLHVEIKNLWPRKTK